MRKLMKIVLWLVAGLVGLVVLVFGAQWYASESGEVVVLHSTAADGSEVATRLWVVEHDGYQYLRAGSKSSGWYQRLVRQPQISLERGQNRKDYRVTFHPELSETVNALMHRKYGWADSFIGALIGGRENAVAIRLNPA